jgi:hypothetical protein
VCSGAQSSQVTRHERRHTGERPFKCDVCDYSAATGATLKVHMRRHADVLGAAAGPDAADATASGAPAAAAATNDTTRPSAAALALPLAPRPPPPPARDTGHV